MANGEGPWYAKLATSTYSFIQGVGVSNVIALILVGAMVYSVTPAVNDIRDFMAEHVTQMGQLIQDEKDDAAQREKQWQIIGKIQSTAHKDREAALTLEQQTCINTAKSTYQSDKCLAIRNSAEAGQDGD